MSNEEYQNMNLSVRPNAYFDTDQQLQFATGIPLETGESWATLDNSEIDLGFLQNYQIKPTGEPIAPLTIDGKNKPQNPSL